MERETGRWKGGEGRNGNKSELKGEWEGHSAQRSKPNEERREGRESVKWRGGQRKRGEDRKKKRRMMKGELRGEGREGREVAVVH